VVGLHQSSRPPPIEEGRRPASALRIAKELQDRLSRADLHLPIADGSDITVQCYSDTWLIQARMNLKASTVGFHEGHIEQHIVRALGARRQRRAHYLREPSAQTQRRLDRKWLERFGEPGRNRTFNPQIKSLLLCQLSYWPSRRKDKREF
jgi:hypothetical protein